MYALVDGNNFYASCERVFNPALIGKPVVVLSNNDGIIIARSNEAKAMGIKMGTPAFEIKKQIENKKVYAFSSNFALYGDMSQRMMRIFSDFTPQVEVYSIDEAFLDFEGFPATDFKELGKELKEKVRKYIGIPVSVGFGPTKTLAKIANRIAKKKMLKTGVALIDTPEKIELALQLTPIEKVWGIGRRYAHFLQKHQVKTAWDFAQLPDAFIKKHLTVNGLRTKEELLGTSCIPMELIPPPKKAIRTARTFSKNTPDRLYIEEAIADFAAKTARKLREEQSVAHLLSVFIKTNRFDTKNPYYSNRFTVQINPPDNSSIVLIKKAKQALHIIYKEGLNYKKAGVMVSGIVPEKNRQLSLFETGEYAKHKKIMHVMDQINAENGREILKIGAQGQSRAWRLRQEHRSGRYTTRWDEIISVKV